MLVVLIGYAAADAFWPLHGDPEPLRSRCIASRG
jgi:hypothetical protein